MRGITDPAKIAALRQALGEHGEVRFKNGGKIKLDRGKLQVTRRSRLVRRFTIGSYAAAYAYVIRPTPRSGPARPKRQPPARDWGPCPF